MDITVAVDKEAIREPFYINDATYADIIAAASAQTPNDNEGRRRRLWWRVKS